MAAQGAERRPLQRRRVRLRPARRAAPTAHPRPPSSLFHFSSWHWVLGVDASSAASLSAYVARLSLAPPSSRLARLTDVGTTVAGGIFCCYDAFTRVDVRCEVRFPGGVSAYTLDGVGERGAPDDAVWRGARVSGFLRHARRPCDGAVRAHPLRTLPCPVSPPHEAALCADAASLRARAEAGAQAQALAHRGPGVLVEGARHWPAAPAEDVVLTTLLRHWLKHHTAHAVGAPFFESLRGTDHATAPSAAWATAALRFSLSDAPGCISALDAAFPTVGRPGWDERAALLRLRALLSLPSASAAPSPALHTAVALAAHRPALRAAWTCLAAAYAAMGEHGRALVALNVTPPLGSREDRAATWGWGWLRHLPPDEGGGFAHPPRRAAVLDGDAAEASAAAHELASLPGRAALKAAALRPPWRVGDTHCGPLRASEEAGRDGYGVLLSIVRSLGWDAFLDLRSAVFLMVKRSAEEWEDDEEEEEEEEGEGGRRCGDGEPSRDAPPHANGADEAQAVAAQQQQAHARNGGGGAHTAGALVDTRQPAAVPPLAARSPRFDPAHPPPPFSHHHTHHPASGAPSGASTPSAASPKPRTSGTAAAGVPRPSEPCPLLVSSPKGVSSGVFPSPKLGGLGSPSSGPTSPLGCAFPSQHGSFASGRPASMEADRAALLHLPQPAAEEPASRDGAPPPCPPPASAFLPSPSSALSPSSSPPFPPARLVSPWLDDLIGRVYADVAALGAWRTAEEEEGAGAAAREALGTQGDWLRRGAACERLRCLEDAERAYRVAVHMGFSWAGWGRLAAIYATWGAALETAAACEQLCAARDAAGWGAPRVAPVSVATPLRTLVAAVGMGAARAAAREAAEGSGGAPHRYVQAALADAVRWKAKGWDA